MATKKKRVQNPDAKREAILNSAAKLFVKRGYEATSIAQIAEDAEVAVGSVYRQFPDKVALLGALHLKIELGLVEVMMDAWDNKLEHLQRFYPMFKSLFAALAEKQAILPILALNKELVGKETYHPGAKMIAAIEEMYVEGVNAGAFKSYPSHLMASIAHGMVNGALIAWAQNPTPQNQKTVVKSVSEMVQAVVRKN